jgi:hypothetical protein
MSKKDGKSGGLTSINGGKSGKTPTQDTPTQRVIDLTQVRAQRNLDNRRTVERYFLHHMIDAVCEFDAGTQVPIEIVEVSEAGCSFRIPTSKSATLPRDAQGALRPIRAKFYFSRDSYLLVGLEVINSTPDIAGGGHTIRFGCKIDETFASTDAYRQFVRFLEAFCAAASRDTKQVSAF